MARPRTPVERARVTGQLSKRRKKFAARGEIGCTETLGDAPAWMTADQRKAWVIFRCELPWLNASHRALVEIACVQRARLMAGEECGVQALQLLRQCLGALGATPADASKVTGLTDGEDDIADTYFN